MHLSKLKATVLVTAMSMVPLLGLAASSQAAANPSRHVTLRWDANAHDFHASADHKSFSFSSVARQEGGAERVDATGRISCRVDFDENAANCIGFFTAKHVDAGLFVAFRLNNISSNRNTLSGRVTGGTGIATGAKGTITGKPDGNGSIEDLTLNFTLPS